MSHVYVAVCLLSFRSNTSNGAQPASPPRQLSGWRHHTGNAEDSGYFLCGSEQNVPEAKCVSEPFFLRFNVSSFHQFPSVDVVTDEITCRSTSSVEDERDREWLGILSSDRSRRSSTEADLPEPSTEPTKAKDPLACSGPRRCFCCESFDPIALGFLSEPASRAKLSGRWAMEVRRRAGGESPLRNTKYQTA